MVKEQVTISILFKIKWPNNRTVKSAVETNKKKKQKKLARNTS